MGADFVISVHLEPGLLDTRPRNTIEVISRSFSIMQSTVHQRWSDVTDVLIAPDVHDILWDEFVRTPELVAAGARATKSAMPKIRELLESRRRWDRKTRAYPEAATARSGDGDAFHAHPTPASRDTDAGLFSAANREASPRSHRQNEARDKVVR
jgi:hypothetical protein